MALNVISAGALSTIQDLGRPEAARFGVPQSGAMDWFALWCANRLVGNSPDLAGLEFIHQGPELCPTVDCLVAVAGPGFNLRIGGRQVGAWRCAVARPGELIQVTSEISAGWGYLAVSGGIDVPLVLGSRSTYLRGAFGGISGRAVQPGDCLPTHPIEGSAWQETTGRSLSSVWRIAYGSKVSVPVIPGPQAAVFGFQGLEAFFAAEYQVTPASDRMGYRLSGPVIPRHIPGELLSEGTTPGSIQVPPDGQPVVLLSDRPATGGYAKIATIARVGLPQLVQALPGVGVVSFHPVEVGEAQQMLRKLIAGIEKGIEDDQD
jgi:antagonist of KipI